MFVIFILFYLFYFIYTSHKSVTFIFFCIFCLFYFILFILEAYKSVKVWHFSFGKFLIVDILFDPIFCCIFYFITLFYFILFYFGILWKSVAHFRFFFLYILYGCYFYFISFILLYFILKAQKSVKVWRLFFHVWSSNGTIKYWNVLIIH